MKRLLLSCTAAFVAVSACADGAAPDCPPGCLSPTAWDSLRWAEAWEVFGAGAEMGAVQAPSGGIVVDAAVAPAAMAGTAALEAGGSAIDAALTATLVTAVVGMGRPVTLAGISALVYHDASSGTTHFLDGGWQTVAAEDALESVPSDVPSGRGILVPGFMAAFESAHERFGRLPFRALFEPAIHLAEEGFEAREGLAAGVRRKRDVLGRLPETRAIFTTADGAWIEAGDVVRQPALARTLRRLSEEGAAYMYQGAWAERLVEAVRRDGGRMTLDDLAAYRALWKETARAVHGPYEVHVPGEDATGGATLIEALHLLDRAGVPGSGPVSGSAESLYRMSRIGYLLWVGDFRAGELEEAFPGLEFDPHTRRTREHADRLWETMRTDRWDEFVAADPFSRSVPVPPAHTDAVVSVDGWGNVAALIYTSNTTNWGQTGLFVDGVSVPDAGILGLNRLQPGLEPGDRVRNGLNPVLVLREGRPVLASAALGAGIHHATVQTLTNILDFGMDPAEAMADPQALHFAWPGAPGVPPGTPVHTHLVEEGRFPDALLDSVRARGQPLLEIPAEAVRLLQGRLSVIRLDPADGTAVGVGARGGGAVAPGEVR